MKKIWFLIIVFLTLQSCLDLRSCNEELVGRYSCYNNENAINYLDIKKDGTFYHYYKEGNTELSHNGSWEITKKNNCVIEFINWKTFNQLGIDYEIFDNKYLYKNRDYLDIGPDGESSTSFKKE